MRYSFWWRTHCLPSNRFYLSWPLNFLFLILFPTFSQSFLSCSLFCLTFPKFIYPSPLPFNPSTMSPAKGESSSHHKGKEVATDDSPWLLLPTKSMVAYVRKQSRSAIFKWREKEKRWYWYASEFLLGWKKKVKVVNLPTPTKKGSVSRTTKPKSTKKGDDSSETCSDIIPCKGGLPPIGNIVLKSSPLSSARPCSNRRSTIGRPKPPTPKPSMDAPPSNRTCGSKRKTSPPASFAIIERRVWYL